MIKIKKIMIFFITAVFMVSLLGGCGNKKQNNNVSKDKENVKAVASDKKVQALHVYSGAGLRKAMDDIAVKFKEKYDVEIQYDYAGSAQLLSQIELTGKGDVFIPGSAYYYDAADKKGFVGERHDVAYHIPAIVVHKDNPAKIKSIEDLAKPGVKVVLGDEKACAIGKVCKKMFEKNKLYEKIQANKIASTATVNELFVYVSMKQADASIMWEDNLKGAEDVEMVEIPKEKNVIKTIPIAVLKGSNNEKMAEKFVDFVCSDEGKNIFKEHGFKSID